MTLVAQTAARPHSSVLLLGVAALSRLPVVSRVDLRATPLCYLVMADDKAEAQALASVLARALDLPVSQ